MFVWNKTFLFGSGFLEPDEFGDWLSIPGYDEDLFGRKSGFRLRPPLPQIPNGNGLHKQECITCFTLGKPRRLEPLAFGRESVFHVIFLTDLTTISPCPLLGTNGFDCLSDVIAAQLLR
jgi:hypothetical protein